MKRLLNRVLAFFFPTRCLLCGRPAAVDVDFLCADCAARPVERVYRYFALRVRREMYTLECRAPMRYREPFRSTLWRFKFRGETSLAAPLAGLMARVLAGEAAQYDCIVPVPVSAERLRERGYDQTVLLAERLAAQTDLPCRSLLRKTRDNRTQHRLTAKERTANVRGAYACDEADGLRVLLVDDIVTTGATARECAAMLHRAGAAEVLCVCCAVVEANSTQ